MGLVAQISEGLRPVVDLVYPPRCPSCGTAIVAQGGLCVDCWTQLEIPEAGAGTGRFHAATLYNETSRKLILAFKHGGKIALAPMLARMMASRLPEREGEAALLVPVPLHRLRLWQRGYNQSAMLARELERLGKGELLVDALVRRKRTPSLGGLGARERQRVLTGAIAIRPGAAIKVKARDIILVDDVMTSGATSNACIEALLGAGARSVSVACFALAGWEQARSAKTETPEVR